MQTTHLARRSMTSRLTLGAALVAAVFVLTLTIITADSRPPTASGRLTIDPTGLAYVETEGWRAYYDRDWPRAVSLMLQLNHDQFGLPWPTALTASYHATRAQMAFAGTDNNAPLAREYLACYYADVARGRGLAWDAEAVADAEMRYWIVHRQVAQRPDDPAPLVDALADLHVILFEIPPAIAHASAIERTAAAQAVDRITSRRSADMDADWRAVESHLRAAYSLIADAMR